MNFIEALVNAEVARANCVKHYNVGWEDKWEERIEQLKNLLPSGSGFDAGTKVVSISPDLVEFQVDFHHHNEQGYNGWTNHTVKVKPSFIGTLDIKIGGLNRESIKDYIAETFHQLLTQNAPPLPWAKGD